MREKDISRLNKLLDLLREGQSGKTMRMILAGPSYEGDRTEEARKKALQRDLRVLEDRGLVRNLSGTRRPYHYVSVASDYRLSFDEKSIKKDDALLAMLALANLQGAMPQALVTRLEKLQDKAKDRLRKEQSEWANRVRIFPNGYQLKASAIKEGVMEAIHDAIDKKSQLKLVVTGRSSAKDPDYKFECVVLGLLIRPPLTKLVICGSPEAAPSTINVADVVEASVADRAEFKLSGFDLDEWLKKGGDDEPIGDGDIQSLHLCCTHRRAAHWKRYPVGSAQQILNSPHEAMKEVKAKVVDSIELRRYLLSLGTEVQVLEPHAIRDWLLEQVKLMAEKNIGDQTA